MTLFFTADDLVVHRKNAAIAKATGSGCEYAVSPLYGGIGGDIVASPLIGSAELSLEN